MGATTGDDLVDDRLSPCELVLSWSTRSGSYALGSRGCASRKACAAAPRVEKRVPGCSLNQPINRSSISIRCPRPITWGCIVRVKTPPGTSRRIKVNSLCQISSTLEGAECPGEFNPSDRIETYSK